MSSFANLQSHVYLIQLEKDFNTDIYKIGTTQRKPELRFREYCTKYKIILCEKVDDGHKTEQLIIYHFKREFGKAVRHNEYFKGDISLMIEIFVQNIIEPQIPKKRYRCQQLTNSSGNQCMFLEKKPGEGYCHIHLYRSKLSKII
tara:strand:+ start:311 stop:745 length:435 start_codon:yes stop_codon:yes gene_type:complete